jgi:hypothetical protein
MARAFRPGHLLSLICRRAGCSPALLLFVAVAGCRSNTDLVEAELRARESQVHELKGELGRTEAYNEALQREVHDLRHGAPTLMPQALSPESYTVKEVALGRLTGGYNDGHHPGDEALQVVLEPRDPDGSAIKAPGSLHVLALEVNNQGLKTPFSTWDISPEQLRRSWKSGLFATGYHLILPWQMQPTSERVRVVAQFALADGRLFEADRDVTVHLPPQHQPPPVPVPLEEMPPPSPMMPPPVLKKDGQTDSISLRPAEILPPRPLPGGAR